MNTPRDERAEADTPRDGELACGCQPHCETHGREEIAVDADGNEFCNECAADGWSGELCHPEPGSCDMRNAECNVWERQFMCERHAAEHVKFCEETLHAVEKERAGPETEPFTNENPVVFHGVSAECRKIAKQGALSVTVVQCADEIAPVEPAHGATPVQPTMDDEARLIAACKAWYDAHWLGNRAHGKVVPQNGDPHYTKYLDGYMLALAAWISATRAERAHAAKGE
ncbi:MAG: hypothetical protein K8D98_00185 [Rhodanobacter sp.]|nr:hypothetical protein [Rhodanobacter sp.]